MTCWLRSLSVILCALAFHNPLSAQELRIYTRVHDLSGPSSQRAPEQCSLTLFHAGKVYDYIEPGQEVTIFEPALRRFTVLNARRQLRTELTQDEIRQFLGLAETEAHRRLDNANDQFPASRKSLELLTFLLKPEFSATFDSAKLQISLTSPQFQYIAEGFVPPSPEIVTKYLHVADWMAQFNSVLHPQSMLPAPRLQLNQEFRHRGLVPSHVRLQVESESTIQIEARHEWTWNLQKTDRQLIDDWEKQLQSPKFRQVNFRQFQQEMLRTETAKRH